MKNNYIFIVLLLSVSQIVSSFGQQYSGKNMMLHDSEAKQEDSRVFYNKAKPEIDQFASQLASNNPQGRTYDTILCFDTLNNLITRLTNVYNDSSWLTERNYESIKTDSIVHHTHFYYKYNNDGSLSEYEYHIFTQTYTQKQKYIYSYLENGKNIIIDTYIWQDSVWRQINIVHIYFDTNNQLIKQLYYYLSSITHVMMLYTTIDFTYNEIGNLLTKSEVTREDGVFLFADTIINTYDISGFYKMQELHKFYWQDSITLSIELEDYTYDQLWQITSIVYSRGNSAGIQAYRSDTLVYNNGKLYSNTSEYYNYISGLWKISGQTVYEYPGANVFITTLWDLSGDTLSPIYKTTKSYDENNDLQQAIFEYFRPEPSVIRTQYEFENRNAIKGISEKFVNGIWMPCNEPYLNVQCKGEDVTGALQETYRFSASFFNPEAHGIDDIYINESQFNIYPNPVKRFLFIEETGDSFPYELQLFSSDGKLLCSTHSLQKLAMMDIQNLRAGTYHLRIGYNNRVVSRKIIKSE